jgi:hypothetical protein
MSWDEWEALEWWEQYSLIYGLREEGGVGQEPGSVPNRPPEQSAKTEKDQALQGIGVRVRTVEGKADW